MHTTFKGEERPHPTIKRCAKVITGIEKIAALHKGKKPYISILAHGIKATFNAPLRYEKKKKRVGLGIQLQTFISQMRTRASPLGEEARWSPAILRQFT